jgi:GDPmannose 4,6-dehydratase
MKKALIFGISGQDGSYLAELLLEEGYEVHGVVRRLSIIGTKRIDHIIDKLKLHFGDLTDELSLQKIITDVKPDEIYNLAAQSQVRVSFDIPVYTANVNALGALRILEIIRCSLSECKYYQASSSEMFGKVQEIPQTEKTPLYPRSPYGCAKTFAFYATRMYREAYGMKTYNGILFNHESPRRGDTFVTKKIVNGFAKIKNGKLGHIKIGNLEAKRDWGYAGDYVNAIYQMVQKEPDDYVVCTGETRSVRELIERVAKYNGFEIIWKHKGNKEIGIDKTSGRKLIRIDKSYYRPAEVDLLQGYCGKLERSINWHRTLSFDDLIKLMVEESWKENK